MPTVGDASRSINGSRPSAARRARRRTHQSATIASIATGGVSVSDDRSKSIDIRHRQIDRLVAGIVDSLVVERGDFHRERDISRNGFSRIAAGEYRIRRDRAAASNELERTVVRGRGATSRMAEALPPATPIPASGERRRRARRLASEARTTLQRRARQRLGVNPAARSPWWSKRAGQASVHSTEARHGRRQQIQLAIAGRRVASRPWVGVSINVADSALPIGSNRRASVRRRPAAVRSATTSGVRRVIVASSGAVRHHRRSRRTIVDSESSNDVRSQDGSDAATSCVDSTTKERTPAPFGSSGRADRRRCASARAVPRSPCRRRAPRGRAQRRMTSN